MPTDVSTKLGELIQKYETELLEAWIKQLVDVTQTGMFREGELQEDCGHFLRLLRDALLSSTSRTMDTREWQQLKQILGDLARVWSTKGVSPSDTALFVLSLKKPLFTRLREGNQDDSDQLADETWAATKLLDRLGLWTTETFLRNREDIIRRQQEEMIELSTPVVKLWDNVLALPIIGTLDSSRSQIVMESLLSKIVETGAEIAIIDITGVPTVDTLTAQHLLKTVTAARLMGAECIISGVRPQIAQTIVHLGVDLQNVVTKSNIRDAFSLALRKSGKAVCELPSPNSKSRG